MVKNSQLLLHWHNRHQPLVYSVVRLQIKTPNIGQSTARIFVQELVILE